MIVTLLKRCYRALTFAQWRETSKQLQNKGILGMNRRNVGYISRYNSRDLFPLVDNKLLTKNLAIEHRLTVPELLHVVSIQHQVNSVVSALKKEQGFCIKPAKGSGGKGILVVTKVENGVFQKSNGQIITDLDVQRHLSNILAGLFSLGGATDVAMVEALMVVDPRLTRYSFEGVPDIRIIVFCGVPVMAMLRLACKASHGKANLHQGAIGVGINLANGCAINAVQHDLPVTLHPDTKAQLMELQLDNWRGFLELACACYDMTGLGYLGVDLVMDANHGPTMLELNARPGLSIQIANNTGLLTRLQLVESTKKISRMTASERVDFAMKHFGVFEP